MKGNPARTEELFRPLNSGHRKRGGFAVRMVGRSASIKGQRFRTFSPTVIARSR